MPSASATIALITSPWLDATQIASAPCSAVILASQSRIAATPRACMSRIDSPPGNVTPLGWACTAFQSGSLASCLELATGPVAVPALGQPLVGRDVERRVECRRRPPRRSAGSAPAGWTRRPRSAARAIRAAVSAACCEPDVVELDAGRAAGEHAGRVRRRSAMPDQENSRHAITLAAASPRRGSTRTGASGSTMEP